MGGDSAGGGGDPSDMGDFGGSRNASAFAGNASNPFGGALDSGGSGEAASNLANAAAANQAITGEANTAALGGVAPGQSSATGFNTANTLASGNKISGGAISAINSATPGLGSPQAGSATGSLLGGEQDDKLGGATQGVNQQAADRADRAAANPAAAPAQDSRVSEARAANQAAQQAAARGTPKNNFDPLNVEGNRLLGSAISTPGSRASKGKQQDTTKTSGTRNPTDTESDRQAIMNGTFDTRAPAGDDKLGGAEDRAKGKGGQDDVSAAASRADRAQLGATQAAPAPTTQQVTDMVLGDGPSPQKSFLDQLTGKDATSVQRQGSAARGADVASGAARGALTGGPIGALIGGVAGGFSREIGNSIADARGARSRSSFQNPDVAVGSTSTGSKLGTPTTDEQDTSPFGGGSETSSGTSKAPKRQTTVQKAQSAKTATLSAIQRVARQRARAVSSSTSGRGVGQIASRTLLGT